MTVYLTGCTVAQSIEMPCPNLVPPRYSKADGLAIASHLQLNLEDLDPYYELSRDVF